MSLRRWKIDRETREIARKGKRCCMKEETYKIMGACFEVYKEKGCGLLKLRSWLMKIIYIGLLFLFVSVLSGCATASFIENAETTESPFDKALIYKGVRSQVNPPVEGREQYRVFHRGATGFTPQAAVRRSAMNRVTE